ncbi:DUF551 domain-containing protein [Escherichia coli]|nr:DUF551 domain-containing protein [Escherichia coli]EEY5085739.1 DUF551 domain-containing protein [Escherichia coli]EFJ6730204.1 DUF551 domain-containing protein [Escherichia coli]GDH40452.1 hypothetical protein BvCmsKKP048_02215 [Escherichia coli]GDI08158.1 hypothetical protein BvCmsKKP051_00638 [Escherichia coli]
MAELTKWLQNTITSIESARDEIPFGLDEDQSNMLTAFTFRRGEATIKPGNGIEQATHKMKLPEPPQEVTDER